MKWYGLLKQISLGPFLNTLSHIEIKGCFYHLSTNIWKRIQEFVLQQWYKGDQKFALYLTLLSAIAFLPPNCLIRGFEELADHLRNVYNGAVDDLLEYFEYTYIGRYWGNALCRQASFPIQFWNIFHRTNN